MRVNKDSISASRIIRDQGVRISGRVSADRHASVTPVVNDEKTRAGEILLAARVRGYTRLWRHGPNYPSMSMGIFGFRDDNLTSFVVGIPELAKSIVEGRAVFSRRPHTEVYRARMVGSRIDFESVPVPQRTKSK